MGGNWQKGVDEGDSKTVIMGKISSDMYIKSIRRGKKLSRRTSRLEVQKTKPSQVFGESEETVRGN